MPFFAPPPLASGTPLFVEAAPPVWLYLSLNGRINRATFWRGLLGLVVAGLVLQALLMVAGLRSEPAGKLVNLVLLWPAVALSAKRWHDHNRSAAWVWLGLAGFAPGLWGLWVWLLVDNGFRRGSAQANRFGPPPLTDLRVSLAPSKPQARASRHQ